MYSINSQIVRSRIFSRGKGNHRNIKIVDSCFLHVIIPAFYSAIERDAVSDDMISGRGYNQLISTSFCQIIYLTREQKMIQKYMTSDQKNDSKNKVHFLKQQKTIQGKFPCDTPTTMGILFGELGTTGPCFVLATYRSKKL